MLRACLFTVFLLSDFTSFEFTWFSRTKFPLSDCGLANKQIFRVYLFPKIYSQKLEITSIKLIRKLHTDDTEKSTKSQLICLSGHGNSLCNSQSVDRHQLRTVGFSLNTSVASSLKAERRPLRSYFLSGMGLPKIVFPMNNSYRGI